MGINGHWPTIVVYSSSSSSLCGAGHASDFDYDTLRLLFCMSRARPASTVLAQTNMKPNQRVTECCCRLEFFDV